MRIGKGILLGGIVLVLGAALLLRERSVSRRGPAVRSAPAQAEPERTRRAELQASAGAPRAPADGAPARTEIPAGAAPAVEVVVAGLVLVNGAAPAEPVPLAITPVADGADRAELLTGPGGTFRFAGLEARSELRIHVPDWMEPEDREQLLVTAPCTALVLELSQGPLLTGRILAPGGAGPVPLAEIGDMLEAARMGMGSGTAADDAGRFRIPMHGMQSGPGTASLETRPVDGRAES